MNKLLIITIILAIFPIMQTFANEIENSPDVSIEEKPQVTPKFSLDEKSIEGKTYKATRRTALGSIFFVIFRNVDIGIYSPICMAYIHKRTMGAYFVLFYDYSTTRFSYSRNYNAW